MGDIEIQIRRSTKSTEAYEKKESISSTPVKISSVTYQNDDQIKKNTIEEKPNTNQTYWDYSVSHGKTTKNHKRSFFYSIIYLMLR
jgi:hypothetical protein